ncbi:MAG: hypothetical protein RR454_00460 [Clostridia bacterium]
MLFLIFTNPNNALALMLQGAENSISLCLKLCAVYCIWLSFLNLLQKTGLSKKLSRLLLPVTKKMFKGENDQTLELINMNFTANMLGLGGVATPLGIKAINSMQDGSNIATHNMVLFLIINVTSLQLLPTTIISLRTANQSANASDIILPTFISSFVITLIGVAFCFLFKQFSKVKNE